MTWGDSQDEILRTEVSRFLAGERWQARWCLDWVGEAEVGEWRPPVPLCYVVIRRPSGSSGLFELYVPLIIHLRCSALSQAHKGLIYSRAGNERSWRCWAGSSDCWPRCQVIELMDGLQCHSTPTTTDSAL